MKRFVFLCLLLISNMSYAYEKTSDDQIKQKMIQESISNYSGNCPCPYNTMRNGNRCGDRSAYSKPGGASPICYPSDISPSMIRTYRRMHGE